MRLASVLRSRAGSGYKNMPATELQVISLVNMMMQLYKRRHDKSLKKQYDLQRDRYENMASGGDGGKAGLYGRRPTDAKRSTHEASIRELHHSAWSDEDFIRFLGELDKSISQHHQEINEPIEESDTSDKPDVEAIADTVYDLMSSLEHNDIVYILNDIADQLGVGEPDSD